jgi:hypothetical protein
MITLSGGLQPMLEKLAVVVTGDHSQSDLAPSPDDADIKLEKVLAGYSIVPAGNEWRGGDELMICPNMRAAQIYLRPGYWTDRAEIIDRLLAEPRIDQVMWRERDNRGEARYLVQTAERGRLEFAPAANGVNRYKDEYDTVWSCQGSLAAIDAHVSTDGILQYGDYPNALERIALSFDEQDSGDLWLTSRLGHAFSVPNTSVHRGGSHGSLHRLDSLSPLILAGLSQELRPVRTPRSVDVTPICLAALGLPTVRRVGEGHVREQS